jgi:alpha-tubulin suppressor-like RCC1 family protein
MKMKLRALIFALLFLASGIACRAGTVVAWGAGTNYTIWPNYGQSSVPAGLSDVIAVAAGSLHTLVLKSDGTLAAWGYGASGETNIPSNVSNVVAIAGSGFYSNQYGFGLALKNNGTIAVIGTGITAPPVGLSNVVAIAAGAGSGLALKSDGTVAGWGYGSAGYYMTNGAVTFDDGILSNVVALAGGDNFSLALRRDGTVIGWGRNLSGQATGIPSSSLSYTNGVVQLGGQILSNVVAVAAGNSHSLALKSDGTVVAWGDNTYGQINVPTGLNGVVALALGGAESTGHCLALKSNGVIVAWGMNSYHQTNVPGSLSNVVSFGIGSSHCVALSGDAPPILHATSTQPSWTSNGFTLSIPSQSGRVYALEYKDSLTGSTWTPLPLVAGNGGALTLVDPNPAGPQRLYRVRRW